MSLLPASNRACIPEVPNAPARERSKSTALSACQMDGIYISEKTHLPLAVMLLFLFTLQHILAVFPDCNPILRDAVVAVLPQPMRTDIVGEKALGTLAESAWQPGMGPSSIGSHQ